MVCSLLSQPDMNILYNNSLANDEINKPAEFK